MSLPGFRISKVSIPIYISNDGSFFYPKLFPVSLLYYCIVYVNLIKDRSFLTPSVSGKAVAKVRSFWHILQIFAELFSKFFSERSSGVSFPKAGAKVRSLFQTAKRSAKFFSRFFSEGCRGKGRPLGPLLRKAGPEPQTVRSTLRQTSLQHSVKHRRFLSESGCKSTGYFHTRKICASYFLNFSAGFYANCWFTDMLQNIFLQGPEKEQEGGTHYSISRGRNARALQLQLQLQLRKRKR